MAEKDVRRNKALFTHEASEAGHLYNFALQDRAPGPYRQQRRVEAIIDIDADGNLAGVELIDNMPPPPHNEKG